MGYLRALEGIQRLEQARSGWGVGTLMRAGALPNVAEAVVRGDSSLTSLPYLLRQFESVEHDKEWTARFRQAEGILLRGRRVTGASLRQTPLEVAVLRPEVAAEKIGAAIGGPAARALKKIDESISAAIGGQDSVFLPDGERFVVGSRFVKDNQPRWHQLDHPVHVQRRP